MRIGGSGGLGVEPGNVCGHGKRIVNEDGPLNDELTRYRDDLKVEEFRFRMQWPGIEQDQMLDAIRRFGRIAASL